MLGDSLSAGYQMPIEEAWPSLLPDALSKHNINAKVINASISGDTTGNGLARLPKLLQQYQPDAVFVELGANDGLRGFPPHIVTGNLSQIIKLSKASGADVILSQIRVPPNYGKRYSDAFFDVYPKLSQHQNVALIPFFLEGVIVRPEWMMTDGLHPTSEAQPWIADFVAKHLSEHLTF